MYACYLINKIVPYPCRKQGYLVPLSTELDENRINSSYFQTTACFKQQLPHL